MNLLKRFLPETKGKYKTYSKVFIPVILTSMLFSINGMVDNFMVGKYNAAGSVASVNAWTTIMMGFITGLSIIGSVIFIQFYGQNNVSKLKEISRLMVLFGVVVSLLFVFIALFFPEWTISLFLKPPLESSFSSTDFIKEMHTYNNNVLMASNYLKIIVFSWSFQGISFALSTQLKQTGHTKKIFQYSLLVVLTNISLNFLLIQVFDVGIKGAAWATVGSGLLGLFLSIAFIYKNKLSFGFNPLSLFRTSHSVWKMYYSRWYMAVASASATFFITIRQSFFESGFPQGQIAPGVSAMSVLAITGAIQSMFLTTFNAIGIMSTTFVGLELGKGNIEQAKKNAEELKLFNSLAALILGSMLFCLAFFVPYFTFLVDPSDPNIDTASQLREVRNVLILISTQYPVWIWFSTSYRNSLSGGESKSFAFADWFVAGPFQLSWLAFLTFVILPNSSIGNNFTLFYGIFFISDVFKLFLFEFIYYKIPWAFTIDSPEDKD